MIFQDPRASINPVRRIGDYLTEGLRASGVSRAKARSEALALLEKVGFRDPARALRQYPYEFSGGMLQRVVIAGALSIRPSLLLADEPTTALDVTTQAEVVALLKDLQAERGMGLVFVTHDLGLAAAVCDRVYVMYAGRIVEHAPSDAPVPGAGAPVHRRAPRGTSGAARTAPGAACHPRAAAGPGRGADRLLVPRPLPAGRRGVRGRGARRLRPHGGADVACIRPGTGELVMTATTPSWRCGA